MALYTPPPPPGSSNDGSPGSRNQSNNKNNGSSSPENDGDDEPIAPADPNRWYPNPSFGLSVWGPLVPASDCRSCLYTLSAIQIATGLFLWWAPAKTPFRKSPNSPYSSGNGYKPPTQTTAVNSTGVKLPPSFTQYAQHHPQAQYPVSQPYQAYGQPIQPTQPASKIWMRRAVRAASIFSGTYLIFLAGLELVRLQLTYDPWAEDAAKARTRAEKEERKKSQSLLENNAGAGKSNASKKSTFSSFVSQWFGPKGYEAVSYEEWKKRVDDHFEGRVSKQDKGSKISPYFGFNTNPASVAQTNPKGMEKNVALLAALRIANRMRAAEILQQLKDPKGKKIDTDFGDDFYDQFTKESGLGSSSKETKHKDVGRSSPLHASLNGINGLSADADLTPEEEAELEALKPKSPSEIDAEQVSSYWETQFWEHFLLFRPIIHFIPAEAKVKYAQEKYRQQVEEDEEIESEAQNILFGELSKELNLDLESKSKEIATELSKNELNSKNSMFTPYDPQFYGLDNIDGTEWNDVYVRPIQNLDSGLRELVDWNDLEQRVGKELRGDQRDKLFNSLLRTVVRAAVQNELELGKNKAHPGQTKTDSLFEEISDHSSMSFIKPIGEKDEKNETNKSSGVESKEEKEEEEEEEEDDGYDYYVPSQHKEEEEGDDDDDLKITFGKPKDGKDKTN